MAEFQELIKTFGKTRDYIRDFYVYGFKSREDFSDKSKRTYDNERRRIESWLNGFVQSDYTSKGKSISLALDSNIQDTNPLYRVWKSKSFTSNDIMLHFFILDILSPGNMKSVEEITNEILNEYQVLFETQVVRNKLREYVNEGILSHQKRGKELIYTRDTTFPSNLLKDKKNFLDAIGFYHISLPMGVIGNTILDHQSSSNCTFRMKHGYYVHTLEDEILISLLKAMKDKSSITFDYKSVKTKQLNQINAIPLKIFISTRTGRRYLCVYHFKTNRFSNYRLDYIQNVDQEKSEADYDHYRLKLKENLPMTWGVSFGNHHKADFIKMTLSIDERNERHILQRLKREGKDGIIKRIDANLYTYEKEVFDGNEMLPWIRTFLGRIVEFETNNTLLKNKFYRDILQMSKMYEE